MRKYLFKILTLSGVLLLSFSTDGGNGWKLRKSEDGIRVYTRISQGSNILEYKAVASFDCQPSELKNELDNPKGYTKWMYNLKAARLLEKTDSNNIYAYYLTSVPWPFNDRDIVVLQKTKIRNDSTILIEISSHPDRYPEQKGIFRIKKAHGYWLLKRKSYGKTGVTYSFFSDPGGNLPVWLVNSFIVDSPYESLKSLKQKINQK